LGRLTMSDTPTGDKPLPFHPAADLFPLLDGEDYDALKADIAANGLHVRIWTCQGQILDGRNRYLACRELGIEPLFTEYLGRDPFGFVLSLNLHRRHLTVEQRREVVAKLRAGGMSTRAIASKLNVSDGTVRNDLRAGGAQSYAPEPATVTGRDGKTYAATR